MAYLVAVRKRDEQELGVDDLVMIQHCVPLVAATIGEAWHLAMPRGAIVEASQQVYER